MKTLLSTALVLALSGTASAAEPKYSPPSLPNDAAVQKRLELQRGVHPRLYLDAKKVAALRAAVKSTHAPMWAKLQKEAERIMKSSPPAYRADNDAGQEWQRDVGNAMPNLAMAWVISGEKRYLDAAKEWALASCGYETWGQGKQNGMDLAAGHQLYGLALVYDWCYGDLNEATRKTIHDTLETRGGAMYEASVSGQISQARMYLQNHLWVKACGLALAGMAISDDVKGTGKWVGFTLDVWRHTHESLGSDGASQEGVGYWDYGVEYLLKFMSLAREQFGVDFYNHPWWRNTAYYPLYLSPPRDAWARKNSTVDFADDGREHYYGPDYLLHALAHEYRNGHAQWLAKEVSEAKVDLPISIWLDLLWFDPAIQPQPPAKLPTLHRFDDMELVSARTDWSGNESLVVFKCGPCLGHDAMKKFDYDAGAAHAHPDANHFAIFGNGEWLIRNAGYLKLKSAANENTLLVDGIGQIGEGAEWFDGKAALVAKSDPRVLAATSTPLLDHIVGDASDAYSRETGLKHFYRHVLFLKPNTLIVADEVLLASSHALELRFHPENTATKQTDGTFVARGEKAAVRIEPLTPDKVDISAGEDKVETHSNGPKTVFSVRLQTKRNAWRNAVAITWSSEKGQPPRVRMSQLGQRWVFICGTHDVTLDWQKGDARVTR